MHESIDTYTVHVYIAMHTGYAYEEQESFCFSASCNYKKTLLIYCADPVHWYLLKNNKS